MSDLIEFLESFNRKERFFPASQALGNFQLSDHFRRKPGKTVCAEIPAGAFAAMDYHLDWLADSLIANQRGDTSEPFENPKQVIKGNQEDIDPLIAFREEEMYYLIPVEAKAYGSWDNEQIKSKAKRLKKLFGENGDSCSGVKPYFCITSPTESKNLETKKWPNWMAEGESQPKHIKLNAPESSKRRIVTGSDKDGNHLGSVVIFTVIPAFAGIQRLLAANAYLPDTGFWVPAFAGMTETRAMTETDAWRPIFLN